MTTLYLKLLKRATTFVLICFALAVGAIIYSEGRFIFGHDSAFLSVPYTTLQLAADRPASITEKNYVLNFDQDRHIAVNFAYGKLSAFRQDSWLLWAINGPLLLRLLIALSIVWQVKRVVETIGSERVFSQGNIGRIRWIGLAIILAKLLTLVPWWLTRSYLIGKLDQQGIQYSESHPFLSNVFDSVFVGLLLIALGEVFRSGRQLKQEQELTI